MGLIQVAQLLQVAHFVADGGGAQAHVVFLGNGAGAHRHGGENVVINDGLQNLELALVHAHATHFLSGFGGLSAAVSTHLGRVLTTLDKIAPTGGFVKGFGKKTIMKFL